MVNGLIAGGIGRKEGRQACSQPRILHKAMHQLNRKIASHRSFFTFLMASGTPTQFTSGDIPAESGDIPAENFARVVGLDQTIWYERPSGVAPHALAIQAGFGTSGDRLLDQDQQQKRYRGGRTHSGVVQPTDITELGVIDETTQCEACKAHNAEGKCLCTCGSSLPGLQKEEQETLKNYKTGADSPEQFVVALLKEGPQNHVSLWNMLGRVSRRRGSCQPSTVFTIFVTL